MKNSILLELIDPEGKLFLATHCSAIAVNMIKKPEDSYSGADDI